MTKSRFVEARNILQRMESNMDTAIRLLEEAGLDNPFGRSANRSDGDCDQLIDILDELQHGLKGLLGE